MTDKLIAFYSRAGENYLSGAIKSIETGNTEIAADIIRELTGGDMFRIDQLDPYSSDYNECIEQARADQNGNARPELKEYPKSIDGYNTIYLGFPNYWGTMPMAVFTFLEKFSFDGKIIKPFCTHEGSGLGRSEADIGKLCPKAKVMKGLAIKGTNAAVSKKDIEKWL